MKKIAMAILLLSFSWSSQAQQDLKKAEEAYNLLEYHKAIHYYEESLKKEFSLKAAENLAHCYRLTRQTEKGEHWYKRVVDMGTSAPVNSLYLAQMLQSNGKYEEALQWGEKYSQLNPSDSRGKNLILGIKNRSKYTSNRNLYTIRPSACNLPDHDEFAPFFANGDLFFTSDRDKRNPDGNWSGHRFTRLFMSEPESVNVQVAGKNLDSKFHDGVAWISQDGQKMWFTRNNVLGKESRKSSDNTVNLILLSAIKKGGEWAVDEAFTFNSREYSTAYPTLNQEATLMVLSSNMPGGYGEMDLYITTRSPGGTWSKMINLGPEINTPGNEIFPFLLDDGSLIFSSDGLPGLGGQDFFMAERSGNSWQNPQNLGAPFNSAKDETGFWCRGVLEQGWFSSNFNNPDALYDVFFFEKARKPNIVNGLVVDKYTQIPLKEVNITATDSQTGAVYKAITSEDGQFKLEIPPGLDVSIKVYGIKNGIETSMELVSFQKAENDASRFVQLEHNDPRFTLEGFSLNSKDKSPLEGTLVKLLNKQTGEEKIAYSGPDGKFTFQLEQKSDYVITGFKDRYFSSIVNASTRQYDRSTTLYVNLFLYTQVIIVNEDIPISDPSPMQMKDIHFDLDKYDIRPDAARELDKLVEFLKINPTLKKVQLNAHTDSQGDWNYNQWLSEKRAESTVEYLVKKGISRERLIPKGFGESNIKNHCKNGVPCSDAEHEENRRTELRVLEVN